MRPCAALVGLLICVSVTLQSQDNKPVISRRISMGSEFVQLGMEKQAALEKFSSERYLVRKSSGDLDKWLVLEREGKFLGSFFFVDNKLSSIERLWVPKRDDNAEFARALYSAISDAYSDDYNACKIMPVASNDPNGDSSQQVEILCGSVFILVSDDTVGGSRLGTIRQTIMDMGHPQAPKKRPTQLKPKAEKNTSKPQVSK
jgi:hypothetical protein